MVSSGLRQDAGGYHRTARTPWSVPNRARLRLALSQPQSEHGGGAAPAVPSSARMRPVLSDGRNTLAPLAARPTHGGGQPAVVQVLTPIGQVSDLALLLVGGMI